MPLDNQIEKERRQKQRELIKGEALESLRGHAAWPHIVDIFKEMTAETMEIILDTDRDLSDKAKVKYKVIQEVFERFQSDIDIGRDAKERLKDAMFNQPEDTV